MTLKNTEWKPGERLTYYPLSDEDDGDICNDAGQQIGKTYCVNLGNFLVRAQMLAEWAIREREFLNSLRDGTDDAYRSPRTEQLAENVLRLVEDLTGPQT